MNRYHVTINERHATRHKWILACSHREAAAVAVQSTQLRETDDNGEAVTYRWAINNTRVSVEKIREEVQA